MKRLFVILLLGLLVLPQGGVQAKEAPLAPGHYQVPVTLYHAYSEKLSMGNKGLGEKADVIYDGEKFTIYLEAKKMSFSALTTSLFRFYVGDDEAALYHLAEKRAYRIEIPGKPEKRPAVFVFSLKRQPETVRVLVDPQVSFMGNKPLAARLKFSWNALQKVPDTAAGPFQWAQESEAEQASEKRQFTSEEVSVQLNSPLSEGHLSMEPLSRKDLIAKGLALKPLDQVVGYRLALIGEAQTLPYDESKWGALEVPLEMKEPVRLHFKNAAGVQKVYQYQEGTFQEKAFQAEAKGISLTVDSLGEFALVTTKKGSPLLAGAGLKGPSAKRPGGEVVGNAPLPKVEAALGGEQEATPSSETSQEVPRERPAILFVIALFYLILGGCGLWLSLHYWPKFKDEMGRYQYILQIANKKGGNDFEK